MFDVMIGEEYVEYETYKVWFDEFGIDYICPISIIQNPSYEQLISQLQKNTFGIEDGKGVGEGIVIKNYVYKNKFGRTTWAKIVTSEFKEKHAKEMGNSILQGGKLIEETICEKYITQALVEKEFAKIQNEHGWSSKMIPRLLGVVFYSLVKEECWEFVSEHKNPVIDFKRLKYFSIVFTKLHKPELFL